MALGIALVVFGIVFGEDRLVGYLFIGVGVLLPIISAVRELRNKRVQPVVAMIEHNFAPKLNPPQHYRSILNAFPFDRKTKDAL